MRKPAPLSRGNVALLLLVLISQSGRELRGEARPAAESASALAEVVQVEAGVKSGGDKSGGAQSMALRDDDVWLISTRHLGCPSWKHEATVDLEVSHYSAGGDWMPANLHALLGGDGRLNVVYVHGNRVDSDEAIRRAWDAFGVLQADPAAPPLRLIIWSWPSDQIHGQIRDVRAKGCRTNIEGQYLGWFLSQLEAETPVSLIGYSFGARVVTGAMHVLGGGSLGGQTIPLMLAHGDRNPMQVVLMAAAVHNYWLAPGGCHDQFWNFADRLLVLYNSLDPALKRYRFIEKRGRPAALGYTGAWGLTAADVARTEQLDVRYSVGKTHRESVFFSSPEVIEGVRRQLLSQGLR